MPNGDFYNIFQKSGVKNKISLAEKHLTFAHGHAKVLAI
jgi:hypothetical protein